MEWSEKANNFLIFVSHGKNIIQGSSGNTTVRVSAKKGKNQKSKGVVNDGDPVYDHVFHLDHLPKSITFDVRDGSKKCGSKQLVLGTVDPGRVYKKKLKLETKKNNNAGTLIIYYMLSIKPNRRTALHRPELVHYGYHQFIDEFHTGDLIVFNGRGPIHAFQKVRSGTYYSSVGLVVQLSDRHNTNEDTYILEVSDNIDGNLDSFYQEAITGVSLYKLEKKMHMFFGDAIWWCSLKKPLSDRKIEKLTTFVHSIHGKNDYLENFVPFIDESAQDLFATFDYGTKRGRSLFDLLSAQVVVDALIKCKVLDEHDSHNVLPCHVVENGVYNEPILIKSIDGFHEGKELDETFEEGVPDTDFHFSPNFAEPFELSHRKHEYVSDSESGSSVFESSSEELETLIDDDASLSDTFSGEYGSLESTESENE
eukprot:TRINITY_DN1613_c0_g1_i1.p1 TRINITY_DN1613_c0_g1~~TRINITY_DN1613_c0_g1_i1.p1  ORF type:complete len:424 (-),score=94.92 TRINITY_DN1613_c0_g1_i1:42-1313(-)